MKMICLEKVVLASPGEAFHRWVSGHHIAHELSQLVATHHMLSF
jgi:hypothetical protein